MRAAEDNQRLDPTLGKLQSRVNFYTSLLKAMMGVTLTDIDGALKRAATVNAQPLIKNSVFVAMGGAAKMSMDEPKGDALVRQACELAAAQMTAAKPGV